MLKYCSPAIISHQANTIRALCSVSKLKLDLKSLKILDSSFENANSEGLQLASWAQNIHVFLGTDKTLSDKISLEQTCVAEALDVSSGI